jgi:hypothetical protein
MLQIDTPVLDLIYAEESLPAPEKLIEAMGGEEAAKTLMVLDVDLDAPQYETEINPTLMLRRRNDRRLLVVDESAQPMRKSPRTEPIVPHDLRADRERLVRIVNDTGARLGRLQAFGSWGDAAVVVRHPVDLRAVMLLSWALDPQTDVDGRRRQTPLTQREFEQKLATYAARLEELDELTILSRVPPANLEKRGDVIVVDVLSDRDGSWDVRKSFELEKRIAATELFARLPGARVQVPPPDAAVTEASSVPDSRKTANLRAAAAPEAASPAAAPPAAPAAPAPEPEPEPPKVAGPPIHATELGERIILKIPAERFDTETIGALARKSPELLTSADPVTGKQRDRIHAGEGGFVAPLAFLSEVFIDGKPLDKKRLETDARPGPEGMRLLEVHLPRFGPVLLLDGGPGKRWISSETTADPAALLGVARS